jgi:hypothetical protein
MGGEESFFDFPKDGITAKDHTKDSGYGNAEGTFRSQEVNYNKTHANKNSYSMLPKNQMIISYQK